jgi:hypothetical protein
LPCLLSIFNEFISSKDLRQMTYTLSSISEYRSYPQFIIIAMNKFKLNRLEVNAEFITIITKRVDS